MKEDLSKKIVSFIENYYLINGYSPTIREICEKTGIKSTSTIHSYLNKLASMGILEKTTQKSRAITIKKAELSFRPVPIIGRVTAGEPIFAEENLEGYFPLPEELNLGDEMFILQVKGESMINAGIFDKDKIVVKRQNYAVNGEIVVALIDDSATVKRYEKTKKSVVLHPENTDFNDIVIENYENFKILGVVVGLYRRF